MSDFLHIDIETYSGYDLKKVGVFKYVEHADFEILLFGYSFGNEPVKVVDLTREQLPERVRLALTDENVTKKAFGAQFEMVCIAEHFGLTLDVRQWRCTMLHALTLGLPASLGDVAKVMDIPAQKDTAGSGLISFFSKPCAPNVMNGQRRRNLPSHDRVKWNQYIEYNRQDVVVEKIISERLVAFPVSDREQRLWELDQKINSYGVMTDPQLVRNAIELDDTAKAELLDEAIRLTGLRNPNSANQLKLWLEDNGSPLPNLKAETVEKAILTTQDKRVKRVLELRQELSKTSVSKYQAMEASRCDDGRNRGLLQHYGANRTGRWAGRLIQVHNLPKTPKNVEDLQFARDLLQTGDTEMLDMLYSVSDILKKLIRTAFVPTQGKQFLIADFNSIEARVLAWLAGEEWRMNVFRGHGKIYEASAAHMFGVNIDEVDDDMRSKGKVAELALGYQGSVGAMINMGAVDMGIGEDEMKNIVQTWRAANPNIVQFWRDVENAAMLAVEHQSQIRLDCGVDFIWYNSFLFIRLPSGRLLAYPQARIEQGQYGRAVHYMSGVNRMESTYGGKLVENIVQAIARDILAENLLKVDERGYKIVFHVHDEIIVESNEQDGNLDDVISILSQPVSWAETLPLAAAGFKSSFYRKD